MEAPLGDEGAGFTPEETMRVGRLENKRWVLSDSYDQMVRTGMTTCGRGQRRDRPQAGWIMSKKGGSTQLEID